VGYVDVYRNGVYLPTSDYTATTGTTVVLTNAATVGDTITTISFYVSSVLNAIQQYNGSSTNQTLTTPTLTTPTMSAATLTGTSTFAGGVANAYGFGVGTAVPSSGAGISFPATQSASSDANTLDDYEEGTWTPVFVPGAGSITTQSSAGRYTKIGNMVILTGYVTVTTWGTASGGITVTGCPFSFADKFNANGVETQVNGKSCAGRFDTIGATQFAFVYYDNSSPANTGGNGTNFNFSATYRT
jgi:hypothetical protein